MASSLDYVEYVCEQMRGAGEITYKKMFGDYSIYCNEKCFGVICDNEVFINPTKSALQFIENPTMKVPYQGAKPRILLEELDDSDFLANFITEVCKDIPIKKPKPKKVKQ